MRSPVEHLEPAVRDPRKLRRTALVLVGLMVVSGVGILMSYARMAERQAGDERPQFYGRLVGNFKVWRQDESEAALLDLSGDVVVFAPVCFKQPDGWQATREILLKLEEKYGEREDFHLVCLTVDPENESPRDLAGFAEELGAELPGWWLAAAREESVHKFLKNRLKSGILPHEKDGVWVYDPSLIVMDRDTHLRRASIRENRYARKGVSFDFEQAAQWDEEGRTEGIEGSNGEMLERLLFNTVDTVLGQEKSES